MISFKTSTNSHVQDETSHVALLTIGNYMDKSKWIQYSYYRRRNRGRLKARENPLTIGFDIASDWLSVWHKFSPQTQRGS